MAVHFLSNPRFSVIDLNGNPLTGGYLYFYAAGTSTPVNTYPTIADALALTNANTNPIVLDERGEPTSTNVVLKPGISYKIVVKDSSGSTIWTMDNVYELNTVYDTNGNTVLSFITTSNAVDYFTMGNAATGTAPALRVAGSDTNISMVISGKGTGEVQLGQATSAGVRLNADQPILDSDGNEFIKFSKNASAVNEITVVNGSTGNSPRIDATGGDTNVGLDLLAKGNKYPNLIGGTSASVAASMTLSGTAKVLNHNIASLSTTRTVTWPDADVNFTGIYCARQDAATTSLPDNTFTKMILGTALYDSAGYWDATNHRYTPGVAGLYEVNGAVEVGAATDQAIVGAAIYKNGSVVFISKQRNSGTGTNSATVSGIVTLNGSTDYVELFGFSSAGSQSASGTASANFLTVVRVCAI